jgi:CMP-N-acetylneuraminic acid synthetase
MFLDKKILCIIPARAGSKRIKNKNLLKIQKKTLVEHAYFSAKESKVCDFIYVSTDKKKISQGLPMIKRSKKLAGSKIDISDVIYESLIYVEKKKNLIFDYVICLQPTAPIRNGNLIKSLVENVIKCKANGGITGVKIVPWLWTIKKKKGFNSWYPKKYPKSQSFKNQVFWQEINTVQVASRKAILSKKRWDLPLFIQFLPSYATIDIDHYEDYIAAKLSFSKLKDILKKEKFKEGKLINSIN